MGGIEAVLTREWSLIKSGLMDRLDCILIIIINPLIQFSQNQTYPDNRHNKIRSDARVAVVFWLNLAVQFVNDVSTHK